ncbi:hypothetical protein OUZ56_001479 [Daphnia magna]|uniref:Uncharacterized protein n=1 Tax=Daphnia magna TaxID=35525 RepID=A0ABR0A2S4_9CRUS|nr:hypothetical protein OUZ56_001479 [Daphnia magna]
MRNFFFFFIEPIDAGIFIIFRLEEFNDESHRRLQIAVVIRILKKDVRGCGYTGQTRTKRTSEKLDQRGRAASIT